ncbi:hypothetical protein [Sphaerimonospora mesophila]|uniref:hypothetical protein n=1 Tax=Sphaerimonospora mesophila TaxID=37483 RepID=UPI0006E462E7
MSHAQNSGVTPIDRRPLSVVLAVVLMAPVCAAWLAGGFVWLVVTARMEGDGMIFFWILAVVILALCLLVGYMAGAGMIQAWRGQTQKIRIPAYFTLALFGIALLNLIVKGKISFEPSQLVPLVLGAMAGVALILLNRSASAAWFARGR